MSDKQMGHLFRIIEIGDLLETIRILGDTPPDEPKNAWNATPLIMAAWHGRLAILKYVLKRGADINATYDAGNSALIVAAWHGHKGIVLHLLSEGADVALKNCGGEDALAWAAEHGRSSIVSALLGAGANSVGAALVFGCENGQTEIVDLLLCRGASLETQHGKHHLTPLSAAAYRGHKELVEFLLEQGADIHALDDAALGWACGSQQRGTAKTLISHGANVNGHGAQGKTFLQEAVDEGRTTIENLLRTHGAHD